MTQRLLALTLAALTLAGTACGSKIGDACTSHTDCDTGGQRVCDSAQPGGYCTITECDHGSCPDEAVCVRFFPGLGDAKSCASSTECESDEVCTLAGKCAPLSIERRFCMLECSSQGDCRSGYECRDVELMKAHGGEPVPDPASPEATPTDQFCASRRLCAFDSDCETGERCEPSTKTCGPL